MTTPYRVLLFLSLLAVGSAFCLAQTSAKESTASIAGHVTIGGKGAPGVTVVATLACRLPESKSNRDTRSINY